MDKAPDAFRTISEVADELDIPQHVLRFWETRFTQIKPMKRSGGRRYYRPDDVDLLKGIRRLLYGEGYTIRGVQRILKEHGIKSVQRLADNEASATFGAVEEAIGRSVAEEDYEPAPGGIDLDDDDYEGENEGLDLHAMMAEPDLRAAAAPARSASQATARRAPAFEDDDDDLPAMASPAPRLNLPPLDLPPANNAPARPPVDLAPLKAVLQDLIACREALDAAMKDG
ncbi:transcriptional regulator, MerR family [Rhodopseudomonas palustris HaA2]|uniref:Transcriptional regulator, MerR family n=1 Tax=Rhodopseudomonas palustris (strain HaA2) TaxID=316058 RepID=Q2IWQ6_RHOP2|nr:MerR family transcriptional regulator [Rhodopseudomonas palustris]ABD07354.1 transcriptional regulator, MerR family [Rhodopseudomonas palustris HaA2]